MMRNKPAEAIVKPVADEVTSLTFSRKDQSLLASAPTIALLLLISSLPSFAQGAAKRWTTVTLAGNGAAGCTGDNGPAAQAQLANPYGIIRGRDGALCACEVDNHIIRRIAPDGVITTIAGNGRRGYSGDGGPALQASLNEPDEVRFDRNGDLWLALREGNAVYRFDQKAGVIRRR
jgi:hypothetical protein